MKYGEELTKEQAISHLRNGYTLTHNYFDDNEFIQEHSSSCFILSGKYVIEKSIFWRDRTNDGWNTGWYRYNLNPQSK